MTPKTLWDGFVNLKWYWKVLLAIPVVLGIALLFMWRCSVRVTPEEIVTHHKASVDDRVESHFETEAAAEADRDRMKKIRDEIKEHVKEKYDANAETVDRIDSAGSIGDLLTIADELRGQGKVRYKP
jgi:hypothetical protein